MNKLLTSIRLTLAFALATFGVMVMAPQSAHAGGATFTWNGGGSDNNWSTGNNWGGTAPSDAQNCLKFSGSTRTSSTNNFTAYAGGWQIIFTNSSSAFTLNGNQVKYYDWGGVAPKMENDISAKQTVNFRFGIGSGNTSGMDIYMNNGDIDFNLGADSFFFDAAVELRIHGSGRTATFNQNIIDGSATGSKVRVQDGAILALNAQDTRSSAGEVDIDSGELKVQSSGSITSAAIYLGNGTSTASAKFTLDVTGGGKSWSRSMQVNSVNGGSDYTKRIIASTNTSGTNTYGGVGQTIALRSDVTISVPSSGTFTFTAQITNSTSTTGYMLSGNGNVVLTGTADNSFFGVNVAGGTVILAKTNSSSSVHAIGGPGVTVSAGTVQLGGGGGNQISDGSGVTVSGTGVFDVNGSASQSSETISSLSLTGSGSGSGALINSGGTAFTLTTGGTTLAGDSTIGGSGDLSLPDAISGTGKSLTKAGAGKLTLTASSGYSGDTTITAGTLALSGSGAIGSTSNIVIAGSATFDVSAKTSALTLGANQNLRAGGVGTTATIATTSGKGLTLGTSSALVLSNYNGGSTAPLTITGSGSLTIASGNTVRVHTTTALGAGSYKLVAIGSGNTTAVNGTLPSSANLSFDGSGLTSGGSGTLRITSGELWLDVCVAPATPANPAATKNCSTGAIDLVWNTSSGATTYNIYKSTTSGSFGAASFTGITATNYSDTAVTAGTTYYYKITAVSGGCESLVASSTQVSALAGSTPSAPTAGSNSPICAGSTLNLTATTVTGATYSWTGPNGFTSSSQNPSIANATTAATGTYTVTATLNGCTSSPATTSVTVNSVPATPTASNNGPVCTGTTLSLSTPTVSGATYSWTGPNGFTSSSQNPTVSTSATAAMAGTYSVTVTVSSCPSAAGTTTVTVNTAPAISAGPSSQTVCAGNSVAFSVTASGTSLAYQWRKNGTNISNATNATYTISSPVSGDAASSPGYDCVVSGASPCSSTNSSAATLTVNAAAGITSGPANQSACSGSTATFSVTASGTSPSYAWRKRDSSVGWGANHQWQLQSNDGSFFLQTSAQNNNGTGSCNPGFNGGSDINTNGNAWGLYGGTTSGNGAHATRVFPSALQVGQNFQIDMDNGSVDNNQINGFALNDSNAVTRLRFYFKGGDANYSYDDSTGTHSTGIGFYRFGLRIKVTLTSSTTYSMTVTRCDGTTGSFSGTFITGAPIDRVVLFNNNTTGGDQYNLYFNSIVAGTATDDASSNYTNWSNNNNYGIAPISGATNSSYTTGTLGTSDNNTSYDVIVWTACGGQTNSPIATLTVSANPSATVTPGANSDCVGSTDTFTGSFGSNYFYTWSLVSNYTGASIASGASLQTVTVNNGTTGGQTYGIYVTITSNGCSSVSATTTVTTVAGPAISVQPASVSACTGSTAAFSITASGVSTYQWQFSTDGGGSWNPVTDGTGGTTASYTTPTLTDTSRNGYNYRCQLTGCGGSTTNSDGAATLTVSQKPAISAGPASATKCVGDSVTFSVTASGTSLTYQWRKNGTNISGATLSSYTISSVTNSDAASSPGYDCVVGGASPCASTNSSAATLTVNTPVSITGNPLALSVCAGSTVNFSVTATGTTPSYQWRKNGTNLSNGVQGSGSTVSGATSATLTISGVATGDAASASGYDCVVSGASPCGSQTSTAASLTVNVAPVIGTHPSAQAACTGGSAQFTVATSAGSPLNYVWRKRGSGWGSGNGWTINDNGGGHGIYTSAINGGGNSSNINSSANTSFQLWSATGSGAEAYRSFGSLSVGQTIQVDVDNGYINNGSSVGFGIRNANSQNLWEFYFTGGATSYTINAGSVSPTVSIPITFNGVRITFTLTDATHYSATIQALNGGSTYGPFTGTLLTPVSGTQVPAQVRFWNFQAGAGSDYDFFFNNLYISGIPGTASVGLFSDDASNYTSWSGGDNKGQGPIATVLPSATEFTGMSTATLTVSPATSTDAANYDVVITNSCGAARSNPALLTINTPPSFTTASPLANAYLGASYSQVISGSTGGATGYTFTVTGSLPPGLSLTSGTPNNRSATISGTPSASSNATFTVTMTDTNGCSVSSNYTINASCAGVNVTSSPTTLLNGNVGVSYSGASFFGSSSGGSGGYTFSYTGTLPSGLTLNPTTGVLSGTPDTAQTYNFTIIATDATYGTCSGNQAFSITISACAAITFSPAVPSPGLPGGTYGAAYSQNVTASGDSGAFTFAFSGTTPPGLSWSTVNSTTAQLSGTPTATGTYHPTVTATDTTSGCQQAITYTVTIGCPSVSLSSLPDGTATVAYDQTITASGTGLTGAFTFSKTSGTVPTGLTLETTGQLHGTPTATGSYTFSVQATHTDSGCTGTRSYTIAINCAGISASISGAPSSAICSGTSVSLTAGVTGGVPNYSYSWTKDSSAFGSNTNSITDTPAAGSHSYVVTVTDTNGCSASSSNVTVTVNSAPSIGTAPSDSTVCSGSSATFSVSASGTAPLTYAWRKRGSGWGAGGWQFSNGAGTSAEFIGSATDNNSSDPASNSGADINTSGKSWALYNNGGVAAAIRPFNGSLAVGQTFSIDMDNGNVQSGGTVGFGLQNASGENRFEAFFVGGDSNYRIKPDPTQGSVDTGIAFARSGVRVEFTLTGSDSYSVKITRLVNGATTTMTGSLTGTTSGSSITKVRIFNANAGDCGFGCNANTAYFNSLSFGGTDDNAGNYSTWSNGDDKGQGPLANSGDISGADTDTLTVNPAVSGDAGSYDVRVLNSCGVATSTSATLTVLTLPTATVSGTTAICSNSSTSIQAALTGTGPWYLTWSDSYTQTASSSPATRNVSPASTTTYSVSVVSNATCTGTSSGNALITVNALPTASVSGSTTMCPGGSANLSVALTGAQPWSITWSDSATETNITSSPHTRSVSPSSTTTYTITAVSDANCTGTASGSAQITVTANPTVTATNDAPYYGGAYKIVQGQTVHLSAGSVANAISYNWSKDGGNTTFATGQTVSDTPTATAPYTVYTYTVTVPTTCGTAVGSTSVTVLTADGAGVPDQWKSDHGYANQPSSTVGANGMTLEQSYLAGIDPDTGVFSIASITIDSSGVVTLTWNSAQDGTTPTRYYDVYATTGEFSSMTGATKIGNNIAPAGATTSYQDNAAGATLKFYRVTIAGTTVALTSQVGGVHKLTLVEGANYIAPSLVPASATLAGLLGHNLPQGTGLGDSTVAYLWDQTQQTFSTYYYLTAEGWKNGVTTFDADTDALDLNKGLLVTIPTGQGAQTLRFAGFVSTSKEIQTIQNNGYSVVGSLYPSPVVLSNSLLKESGFVGNNIQAKSDYIYVFNSTTSQWDIRLWMDGSGNWHNSDASLANTNKLLEGKAYLLFRGNRSGNMTWTNPVPYSVPLQGP